MTSILRSPSMLRFLHLEDETKDAELVAETLKGEWPDCQVEWVGNGRDFEARLSGEKFDLILSDYNIPGFNGMAALALSQKMSPQTPFILVSGNTGEEVAVESLKLGATDFVVKNGLSRLIPSVQRALKESREHAELIAVESQLREREKLFSQITGNVSDLIAVLDLEGRRVYNSPSFQSVLGHPKTLRGTDSFREIHPEDRKRVQKIFHETVRTGIGRRTEYRFLLPDGSVRFMESQGAVIRNDQGIIANVLVVSRDVTERVGAEEALRKANTTLKAIFDAAPVALLGLDLEGRVTSWSPGAERIFGWTAEETIGTCCPTVPDEELWNFKEMLRTVVQAGPQTGMVYYRQKKNGTRIPASINSAPLRSATGEATGVMVILEDITDRKRAEEELEKRALQLSHAQKLAKLGSWEYDLINDKVVWSAELYSIFGVTPVDFHPSYESYLEKVHPDDRAFVRREVEQVIQDHQPLNHEWRIVRKDGEIRIIHSQAEILLDAESKPYQLRGTCQDITERRLAEERLRDQAALLDKTQDAIYVRDLEGRIDYWNKGAERVYGWSSAEAIGKLADELFSTSDPIGREEAKRLILEKGEWMGELNQVTKEGKALIVESRRTLLRDDAGKPKCILVINTDVTMRKQVERQMQRSQRLESIGTLAGGVAHDLNNALAPIMMGLEILRMQSPKSAEMITTMETSARRGAEMVRQLLTFAKGAEGARLIIQPRHILQEMEKIIQGTFPKNIQLRTDYDKLRTILGDATQLHQVLLNLCVNARDAMPDGGVLTLEAKNVEVDAAFATSVPEAKIGRYVLWRVTDTGTGIPPEILDRIFEPFFSTKGPDKGTGLGLSTVIGIIKGHGGFLRVYSPPGKGTTFAVYLPVEDSSSPETAFIKKADSSFRANGETVLVVDDDTSVRQIARSVLTALNFKVLTAGDGTEALLLVAENRATLRAVITDLHMPIWMD